MRDSPLGVIRFDASIWSEKTTGYSQASHGVVADPKRSALLTSAVTWPRMDSTAAIDTRHHPRPYPLPAQPPASALPQVTS
jgi:hypothetical protein